MYFCLPFHTAQFKVIISTTNSIQSVVNDCHAQMFAFNLHRSNMSPQIGLRIISKLLWSYDSHMTCHYYLSTVLSGDMPLEPPTAYKQPSNTPIATPSLWVFIEHT